MRAVPVVAAAAALACATPGHAPGPRPAAAEQAALALADEGIARYFARFPEDATRVGYPGANHAAVVDNRPEAVRAWQAEEDRLLARARELRGLAPGSSAWLAHGLLVELLEASVGMRACRPELWNVSSIGGWQGEYAVLAEVQPVGTPELRTAAVARLRAVADVPLREIDNLRAGLRDGYVASRSNVLRVRDELDRLLALPVAEWPYLAPAERDPTPGFREELVRAVAERVLPAARTYRAFLDAYLPGARAELGVSTLPGGAACYAAAIRDGTTLPLDAREVHALGVERLAALRAEMRAIAERTFGTSDVPALLHRLESDPDLTYRTGDALVAHARETVARAEAAMPRAFGTLPRGRVVVKPLADFQARGGGTPQYTGAMGAGRYDGVYFVNPWRPEHQGRAGMEATAFHEAWPGHHLQIALAAESVDRPAIARFVGTNAYAEGWAVYAERLADELGLFSSDLGRLGLLQSEAFRAARLVVDTGIHAFGWDRARAVAFMIDATGFDAELAAAEVDRYAAWPGQALGYMVGALEIRRLRDEARATLGDRFDLRAFHDVVLSTGAVSLPMLRESVGRWVESRRAGR